MDRKQTARTVRKEYSSDVSSRSFGERVRDIQKTAARETTYPLATVPLRRLAFYSSSPVMLVAFEVRKHVIAETEGGVTPRDVSFRNHVPYALYSLNKFARVSLYIFNYFSLAFTSYFS